MQSEHKFGFNPDIDTATAPEDIWDAGGLYTWPVTDTVVSLVSTDAADTEDITVVGVRADFWPIEETVTLTGTTPVLTTGSFFRINRMFISSGVNNVGTITGSINSNVASQITIDKCQTLQAIYTVPNHPPNAPYLRHIWASMGKVQASYAVMELAMREAGEDAWRTKDIYPISESDALDLAIQADVKIAVGTDIRWCATEVSGNNTAIGAGFELIWK